MAANLRSGGAELFSINGGESMAITRYESDVRELIVCFYEGRDVLKFGKMMFKVARKNGAETLRYHTRRCGLARLLSELGPVEVEYVYRFVL